MYRAKNVDPLFGLPHLTRFLFLLSKYSTREKKVSTRVLVVVSVGIGDGCLYSMEMGRGQVKGYLIWAKNAPRKRWDDAR